MNPDLASVRPFKHKWVVSQETWRRLPVECAPFKRRTHREWCVLATNHQMTLGGTKPQLDQTQFFRLDRIGAVRTSIESLRFCKIASKGNRAVGSCPFKR